MFALAFGAAMGPRWRNSEGGRVYLGQQLVNWAQYPCERASFIRRGEWPSRLNIPSRRREMPQPGGLRTKLLIVAPVDTSPRHATVVDFHETFKLVWFLVTNGNLLSLALTYGFNCPVLIVPSTQHLLNHFKGKYRTSRRWSLTFRTISSLLFKSFYQLNG